LATPKSPAILSAKQLKPAVSDFGKGQLVSNWANIVISALAWNLKAWYGLVTLTPAARRDILRMEFKRFLVSFIQIPCQVVVTGRRLVYRILTYSPHLELFMATFDHIRQLKFTWRSRCRD